ncbi:DMT family transporter [Caldovatus sediminis]|uniref:DMT family transporter n=1 Tax=Caldovatus sediminis TaxID=2041189 RepID=UPI001E2D41EE|nr:DMT family transporter [Caldovatus sediminis]
MRAHPLPRPSAATLDATAVGLMVLLCALWGLAQVAVKVGNAGIAPVLHCALRSLGAAALVLLWCRLRGIRLGMRDGSLGPGLLAGLLFAGEFLLIFAGMDRTTAARGVVFLYFSPFVVALGAHWFTPGDRLTGAKLAGLLAAFLGLALAFADSLRLPSARELEGDLMCLAAAVLWGATTVVIKASRLSRLPAAKTLLYQLVVSAAVLPPASLLLGESWTIRWAPLVAAALAYQVLIVASASYVAWFWLIARYPASRLAAFSFLTPVFGVAAGALLLGEPVTPVLAAAVVLIGFGIWLVNRPGPARPAG